jgi:sugar-specific transcriptional regulator TrmB
MPPLEKDNQEYIQLLHRIGFTITQAKLYLTLLRIGKVDVKTLAKNANVPRQEIYRTLGELQEKGLCIKTLSQPLGYEAISIKDGLRIMLDLKADEYARISEKAEKLLTIYNSEETAHSIDQEYKISIVEGRDTIIRMCRNAHSEVRDNVCCCTTMKRWVQIGQEVYQNILYALNKGAKYRTLLEKDNGQINVPEESKILLRQPNFKVRTINGSLKSNAVIFDTNWASLSFYPSKSISESPMMWTNHPSIICGLQAYFEKEWKSAKTWTG